MSKSDQDSEVLARLQEKLAFLEDTVQQLNDAVTSQQRELIEMRNVNELLKEKYRQISVQQAEAEEILDEKPPHY
jgi:uncharacterized coiled-coil protein SlyX